MPIMHYLLTNPTLDAKIQLLQSIPGVYPEKVIGSYRGLKLISRKDSKVKITEIRLQDATLTFHYEEGTPFYAGYLFPDREEDIDKYIRFFDLHYQPVSRYHWLNVTNRTLLEIVNDKDAGYMICCRKSETR